MPELKSHLEDWSLKLEHDNNTIGRCGLEKEEEPESNKSNNVGPVIDSENPSDRQTDMPMDSGKEKESGIIIMRSQNDDTARGDDDIGREEEKITWDHHYWMPVSHPPLVIWIHTAHTHTQIHKP